MIAAILILTLALIVVSLIVSLRIGDLVDTAAGLDARIVKLNKRTEVLETNPAVPPSPAVDSSLAARLTGLEEALARHASADQLAHDAITADFAQKTKQIDGLQNWCRGLEKSQETTAASILTHVTNAVSNVLYRLAATVKDPS